MVKFKKSIAIFLAVALMLSCLPLSALAADIEPASESACNHENSHIVLRKASFPTGGNSYGCVYELYAYAVCDDCGYEVRSPGNDDVVSYPHSSSIYHATCNGRVQTHYYHCGNCGYDLGTKPIVCPAGPHSGPCSALPVSIPAEKY